MLFIYDRRSGSDTTVSVGAACCWCVGACYGGVSGFLCSVTTHDSLVMVVPVFHVDKRDSDTSLS